jgi:WD40 repeat protein
VAFSPNSCTLVVCEPVNGYISFWDTSSGTNIARFDCDAELASFSPDGKTLATGDLDGPIQLWEVSTRKVVATLQGDKKVDRSAAVYSLAFSPDGKVLATGGAGLTFWDMKTRKAIAFHAVGVLSLAFSPDGKSLVSANTDKTLMVWDVATAKQTAVLRGHQDMVEAVAISPDGKTIASGAGWKDTHVRLWDYKTGKTTMVLDDLKDRIKSLAFTPDGKFLACGTLNSRGKVWDMANGKSVSGIGGDIVAISPDGKFLAVGWMSGENYGSVTLTPIKPEK